MINSKKYYASALIIILLLAVTKAFPNDNDQALKCSQISSAQTKLQINLNKLWNILTLPSIDRYYFLITCPLILFVQILVLITYIRYSSLRAKPGNIFCGLIIIQIGLNLHIFINATYKTIFDDIKDPMPYSFIGFCLSMGFMSSFFSLLHFLYLIMFMFHTIFLFRFSLKKKSEAFWRILHAFVILISVLITIFLYLEDFMGLNFYGLCGVTQTRKVGWNIIFPIIEIIASIIFAFLGIFTFVYFRKHMPSGQGFKRRKIQQGKIIFMYVAGFSTFQVLASIMYLLLTLNCTKPKPITMLSVLITITNIVRMLQFVFLIFLIIYNQKFRKKFKYTFKSIFQFGVRKTSHLSTLQNLQLQDVLFDEKLLDMKEKSNDIDLLLLSQVYTIISGVYVAYYQYFRDVNKSQKLKSINYRQSITFSMDNKSIKFYQTQARYLIKLKILPCSIIIHSPKVFSHLLSMDNLNNVFQSFQIVNNSKKLSNLAQGKGGRSGQFFFFSSDNKYVIKTITFQEFQFYRENLQTFMDHYKQNTNSLLAKILGLFTIKGDEMQRTYYLILMKNILGCKRDQILRLYDLKGSKYDRQVLFQQVQINEVSKMTLKDIDFINYEHTLKIDNQKSTQLRETLRNDSNFLKELNLLDYSLLIVKVKWDKPPQQQSFWGHLQRIPHISQRNQYYHIGVIDYMQKWDFQKKSQKWWKNLLGKKDVSAQQPNRYQIRFMEFVDEITQYGVKQTKRQKQNLGIEMKDVRAITEPSKQSNYHEEKMPECKQRNTENF